MDPRAEKRALRRRTIAAILAMDADDRRRQERILAELLPELPGFDGARTVLLYASAFSEEIDTRPMLLGAIAAGKRLICPRVERSERRLRLFHIADPVVDLIPGTLGIPEPRPECSEVGAAEIDWVLVPGLAFDERGYRVGRGAGHYDRLLPTMRPDAPRWALILEPQWAESLPNEPHDVPLDGVASASRTVVTRSRPWAAPHTP